MDEAWRADEAGWNMKLRIDSVQILLKSEIKSSALMQFANADSLKLVAHGYQTSLVTDAQATDGFALQGVLRHDYAAPYYRYDLKMYVGGYAVSQIDSIVIRYKIVSGNSGVLWRLFGNSIYNDNNRFSFTLSGGNSNAAPMGNYQTITLSQAKLLEKLAAEDILDYLSFADASFRANSSWWTTIRIDSIAVNLK